MAGYVLAQVKITDPEKFRDYQRAAGAAIAEAGGRVLAAATTTPLQGELPPLHAVIVEFADIEAATRFYAGGYQAVAALRDAGSDWSAIAVVPGIRMPARPSRRLTS